MLKHVQSTYVLSKAESSYLSNLHFIQSRWCASYLFVPFQPTISTASGAPYSPASPAARQPHAPQNKPDLRTRQERYDWLVKSLHHTYWRLNLKLWDIFADYMALMEHVMGDLGKCVPYCDDCVIGCTTCSRKVVRNLCMWHRDNIADRARIILFDWHSDYHLGTVGEFSN